MIKFKFYGPDDRGLPVSERMPLADVYAFDEDAAETKVLETFTQGDLVLNGTVVRQIPSLMWIPLDDETMDVRTGK